MSSLNYDEYRYLWDLATRKFYLTNFPLHLDIELSSICNLKCRVCFQRHMETDKSLMDMESFMRIIDEGVSHGLCAVKLQSRGEAFLHPKLTECIRYAKDRGILDVQVTTNGLLLDGPMIEEVVSSGLDLLVISYDRYHAVGAGMETEDYDLLMVNLVKDVLREKMKQNRNFPAVRIQNCIQPYGEGETAEAQKKLRKMFPGAQQYLVNPVYNSSEGMAHLPDLSGYRLFPCAYPWQRFVIFSDLSATTCCYDYNCKFNRIGSMEKSSVKELWHSPAMEKIRDAHLGGGRLKLELCGKCHNYALDPESGRPASPSTPVEG